MIIIPDHMETELRDSIIRGMFTLVENNSGGSDQRSCEFCGAWDYVIKGHDPTLKHHHWCIGTQYLALEYTDAEEAFA